MSSVKYPKLLQDIQDKYSSYDYYIALDWSTTVVSIAHMRSSGRTPKVTTMPSDIPQLVKHLKSLRGRKILTFEETTGSQLLYVELRDFVDRIVICDPYRNSLLSDGPKTDEIDAQKLCLLLRAGLLHEVYHTSEEDYWMRKLVRSYLGMVKAGVRTLNQKSALYRALGMQYKKEPFTTDNPMLQFIADHLDQSVEQYRYQKAEYEKKFRQITRKNKVITELSRISGIGAITAVIVYALVLDARRFKKKYHFWGYCGLVSHEKVSGGRSYGKRRGRYVSTLKYVFRSATIAALRGNNDIKNYYDHLLSLGYSTQKAQHAVSRYIATSCYAVMKHKVPYQPYQWRKAMNKAAA